MLILGLLGMYFDAAVVFFIISSLLFRLAMAMLWLRLCMIFALRCGQRTHFMLVCKSRLFRL